MRLNFRSLFTGSLVSMLAATFLGLNAQADDAELSTATIKGTVKFTNVNPDILNRLGPPGNQGITTITVEADSLAPQAGLQAFSFPSAPGKLSGDYSVIVQAGTNAATAVPYKVFALLGLDSDHEGFYTHSVTTEPLVRGDAPVGVDLADFLDGCRVVLDRGLHRLLDRIAPVLDEGAVFRDVPEIVRLARFFQMHIACDRDRH